MSLTTTAIAGLRLKVNFQRAFTCPSWSQQTVWRQPEARREFYFASASKSTTWNWVTRCFSQSTPRILWPCFRRGGTVHCLRLEYSRSPHSLWFRHPAVIHHQINRKVSFETMNPRLQLIKNCRCCHIQLSFVCFLFWGSDLYRSNAKLNL